MKVIIDSNIVFSALLNTQSTIGDILLNSQDQLEFYTCSYLREEIDTHKPRILAKTGYTEIEYREVEFLIYQQIIFFTESLITFDIWKQAVELVRDVDMDDIAFVALSLFLDIKIWTRDKKLQNGLRAKGFNNLISTQELLVYRGNEK